MKQTFAEMLNQSSMLGNLRKLFYRGYGWGGVGWGGGGGGGGGKGPMLS